MSANFPILRAIGAVFMAAVAALMLTVFGAGDTQASWLTIFEKLVIKSVDDLPHPHIRPRAATPELRALEALSPTISRGISPPKTATYVEISDGVAITFRRGEAQHVHSMVENNWLDEFEKSIKADGGSDLIIDYQSLPRLESQLSDLSARRVSLFVAFGKRAAPVRHLGGLGYAIELQPGLVVPLSGVAELPYVLPFLDAPVVKSSVRNVTTFTEEDADTIQKLATEAGESLRLVDSSIIVDGLFDFRVSRPGDVFIFIGHVEGDVFAIRAPNGDLRSSIKLSVLEQQANDAGRSAIFVGCNTFQCTRTSGTIAEITDSEVAAALSRTRDAVTNEDLLAAWGSSERPFAITAEAVREAAGTYYANLEAVAVGNRAVQGLAVSVRLATLLAPPGTDWSAIFISWYGLGAVFALTFFVFDRRVFKGAFDEIYHQLPSPLTEPNVHFRQSVARLALFVLLAPLAASALLATILLGAINLNFRIWRGREQLMHVTWLGILRPYLIPIYGGALAYVIGRALSVAIGCVMVLFATFFGTAALLQLTGVDLSSAMWAGAALTVALVVLCWWRWKYLLPWAVRMVRNTCERALGRFGAAAIEVGFQVVAFAPLALFVVFCVSFAK